LNKIQNRGFVKKIQTKNQKKTEKGKEKKIRKEKKGPGAESGLDPKAAHGPSSPCPKRYPASPSPAANEGAPHVIPSEETGMNTEAPERDPPKLFAESG
jgi:hypothetical protein